MLGTYGFGNCVDNSSFMLSGRVSESASEICFLLLLLLLAKGYTVTRGRLRLASSIKMTIFMCLYVVCYTCLFIYEREVSGHGHLKIYKLIGKSEKNNNLPFYGKKQMKFSAFPVTFFSPLPEVAPFRF